MIMLDILLSVVLIKNIVDNVRIEFCNRSLIVQHKVLLFNHQWVLCLGFGLILLWGNS